ncbi:GNAT family N-acetyltransferase [Lewinella sp. W8]|uniref:GNAT family N-acetyltransferase n=1 Tax=Lewinella sp. W8 TaxID=2528208 RepID=UPI0010682ACE|nr:GNAT family N-acetyltransferase [Lewinella sp. W8]MTB49615.1 GNAT family N-acetyltransferase [Lewinella sp. W8]
MQEISLQLRPISPEDNARVADIIRTVMPEYDCVGEGYSINDPEIDDMSGAYSGDGSQFYVLETVGEGEPVIIGCAGYGPLVGGDGSVCELRKMYLLREGRGLGGGRMLMEACLAGARTDGYRTIYLETVTAMTEAAGLYRAYGFSYLDGPMGATGHSGCDLFMARKL